MPDPDDDARPPVRRRCLAGALLASLIACGGDRARPSGPPAGPRQNILLITVDTLRPDHLGCYGYRRATSPNIDVLARHGVVFRHAITAAARTVQSFPSILTGVYPMVHGLRYEGQSQAVIGDRPTLTHVLKGHGYDTFAVTEGLNVGLQGDFDFYDPDLYLDPQGRKVYLPAKNDHEATLKAAPWLRARKAATAPFFLWMRYTAPHWPYEAPAPYTDMFDPDYRGPHTFNDETHPGEERGDIVFGVTRLPPREVEHAVAHYDGEVAYADQAIGDLLKVLETLGQLDRTIVVVTADHGEGLGEHGYFFEHGAYLYDENVRVPLIVCAPGRLPEGRIVESQARTIDIVPTVLDLLGFEAPAGVQGASLVPRARGEETGPAPPAYSESGRNFYKENPRQYVEGVAGKWRMVRTDRYKLILIPREPGALWELYDLEADPGETKNIVAERPDVAAGLRSTLLGLLGSDPLRADREEPPLPKDLEEQLRSLGYVGDGARR